MAGILNNKERIIDFLITDEGQRQASTGQMKIEYASFTDMHTFYVPSSSFGSGDPSALPDVAEDASSRIYFEATHRYQDVIVPELEAGNSLRPFRTADFEFEGKIIASGTFRSGFSQRATILTGSQIVQISEQSIEGITKNFEDLRILATSDPFSDTTGFVLTPPTGSFSLSNITKMGRTNTNTVALEDVPSLFADRRFAHFPNFKYLPPRNTPIPGDLEGPPMGKYAQLNETEILSLADLEAELSGKSYVDIKFSDTSRDNNLVGQIFEYSSLGVEKLSIVDFGEFGDNDPFSPGKRVFFVGKLKRDADGSETFLNIFTVVFD